MRTAWPRALAGGIAGYAMAAAVILTIGFSTGHWPPGWAAAGVGALMGIAGITAARVGRV